MIMIYCIINNTSFETHSGGRMTKVKLKLETLNIKSFITNQQIEHLKGGADYSNTFTTSSTIDFNRGCTMASGCPCDSKEHDCLDMP